MKNNKHRIHHIAMRTNKIVNKNSLGIKMNGNQSPLHIGIEIYQEFKRYLFLYRYINLRQLHPLRAKNKKKHQKHCKMTNN